MTILNGVLSLKIRVGVIGFGTIGRLVINGMLAHQEFEVVAVFDPALQDNHAQSLVGGEYEGIIIMPSSAALLAMDNIDLVYIATPPTTHVDYCRQVISAKKALWCEKPLSVDVSEAEQLVREVEASGLAAAVNLSLASSPVLDKILTLMQEPEQGRALKVEMRFHFSSWPRHWQSGAAAWLSSREQGGFLREIFSHFAFLQHRLFGVMELMNSDVSFSVPEGCEDYVMASYRTGDIEIKVVGGVGGMGPDINEWTLYSDKRALRYADWNKVSIGTIEGWKELKLDMSQGSVQLQLDEIVKMLSGLPHKLSSFSEALAVQHVVENTLGVHTKASCSN
ncbi:Gfo/Idh/MocA family oxidoreductase [Shewanella sp. VB17]|uniref:Gfo/Idh/MocA family protein n=1 Tax=Shewanella sp. VB17 TaxID=2739432 RepID=UPI001565D51B|nr:Gfo/Idh/MocA family oxidoreductase [Shewanella sp. VB17]NRD75466.1 Gfo/Idh/MocA family oxidoreductase [Shewanella sp. VB17]